MKKLLSLILAMAMAFSLVACGGSSSSDSSSSGDASSADASASSAAASEAEEESSAESEAAAESSSSEAESEAEAEEEAEDAVPDNEVAGDSSAEDAFVVWGWNTDIQNILNNCFAEDYADDYSRIVFVNTGGSDYYQQKLDEILEDPDNELYPDMMGLEIDYVQKYVQSGYLLSLDSIGITDEDLANQYEFNKVVCTNQADGLQYASFWQATPGCWQLRADLCEKYLGTTDPDELQAMFATWEDVEATAAIIHEASGGYCELLSGYDDLFRVYSNNRTSGWYDENDVIQIDEQITAYFEEAKTFYDNGWTYATTQWSADWYANMDGDGETSNAALVYTGCPWFTYWSLTGEAWQDGNTILIAGPQSFYWGGTGLAVTVGCSDTELAAELIRYITCDTESMVKIAEMNSDYLNNAEANAQLLESGEITSSMIVEGQDYLGFYNDLLESMTIDTSICTAEDKTFNDALATYVDMYVQGGVDYDTAISQFVAAMHDTYSYLSIE